MCPQSYHHLYSIITSILSLPLFHHHLYSIITSILSSPLFHHHLYSIITSILSSPLFYHHLYSIITSILSLLQRTDSHVMYVCGPHTVSFFFCVFFCLCDSYFVCMNVCLFVRFFLFRLRIYSSSLSYFNIAELISTNISFIYPCLLYLILSFQLSSFLLFISVDKPNNWL